MNDDDIDNDTVSTNDLLDLIEADVIADGNKQQPQQRRAATAVSSSLGGRNSGRVGGTGIGGANHNGSMAGKGSSFPVSGSRRTSSGNGFRKNNAAAAQSSSAAAVNPVSTKDPFSVRLTPRASRRRAPGNSPLFGSDDEDDENGDEDDDSVGDMSDFQSYKYSNSGTAAISGVKHRNHTTSGKAGINRSSAGNKKQSVSNRQRIPLGGGYGGMFDTDSNLTSKGGTVNGSMNNEDGDSVTTGTSATSRGDSSSISGSVFSFASNFFSKKKQRRNPYSGSSVHSANSRGSSHFYHLDNSFLMRLSLYYLKLPFRLRYFVQLFAIVGVFMLASMNYFIAMETHQGMKGHSSRHAQSQGAMINSQPGNFNSLNTQQQQSFHQQQQYPFIMEGGGASPNQIPRLRVRDPLKFLHNDLRPNELLERATAKFRQSARFGNGDFNTLGDGSSALWGFGGGDNKIGGSGTKPFAYGWKSMPRQIYNDFSTGLSDDTKTIEHSNNAQYFQNKAQKEVGFSDELQHDFTNELGEKSRPPPKGTVAYVLPITTCYANDLDPNVHPRSPNHPKDEASFRDFAMMLRAMIHANSYRNPASGSVYDYKMHAIIHPRAKKCRGVDDLFTVRDGHTNDGDTLDGGGSGNNGKLVDRSVVLQNLGYHISLKYPPLSKSGIHGSEYLKEYMSQSVANEQIVDLIRLYAYEFEEYDAVALVDYDTLILGPVDRAVDLIVDSKDNNGGDAAAVNTMDNAINNNSNNNDDNGIDAVFAWEHLPSLHNPKSVRASLINLSFFLLRPSKDTFQKLVLRYQNAPFSETRGWGTMTGRGAFAGWMTTQGFLTYYYDEVANANKVEMNRCVFGNTGEEYSSLMMGNVDEEGADDPSSLILITNGGKVECDAPSVETGDSQCYDCSKTKFDDVSVADLSYCLAPWQCGTDSQSHNDKDVDNTDASFTNTILASSELCRRFQKIWFDGRLQMEDVHPQLQKGDGKLCVDGRYMPMKLLKPSVAYRPKFME